MKVASLLELSYSACSKNQIRKLPKQLKSDIRERIIPEEKVIKFIERKYKKKFPYTLIKTFKHWNRWEEIQKPHLALSILPTTLFQLIAILRKLQWITLDELKYLELHDDYMDEYKDRIIQAREMLYEIIEKSILPRMFENTTYFDTDRIYNFLKHNCPQIIDCWNAENDFWEDKEYHIIANFLSS